MVLTCRGWPSTDKVHVLVKAGVAKGAAGNSEGGGASDGSRNDLAQNSPKWPDRNISGFKFGDDVPVGACYGHESITARRDATQISPSDRGESAGLRPCVRDAVGEPLGRSAGSG